MKIDNKEINPKHFCIFIGHGRTGHSLVGGLIDAHPNAIISYEFRALYFIDKNYGKKPNKKLKEELFNNIYENTKIRAQHGGIQSNYCYNVPGQYQGKFEDLQIIGDKQGAWVAILLAKDWTSLKKLEEVVELPIKILHVIRNPFDVITSATIMKPNRIIDEFIIRYEKRNSTIQKLKKERKILDIYLDDLINNPMKELENICVYLGLNPMPQYIKDCTSIIKKRIRITRNFRKWKESQTKRVNDMIEQYDWLKRYETI